MKVSRIFAALGVAALAASVTAGAGDVPKSGDGVIASARMTITRNGSQPSIKGSPDLFTGSVRIDPLQLKPNDSSKLSSAYVTFEPGARSAWHTHPLGQLLIVTAGTGWVQQQGEIKQEIKPGDVIWTPPGVKHWHGATATTGMTHLAMQEFMNGRNVNWLEKVSDEQFGK